MFAVAVNDQALSGIPSVQPDHVNIHDYRSFSVPTNLVEAAIEEAFEAASAKLLEPEAGAGLSVIGSRDELLNRAAVSYFSGLLNRVDGKSLYAGVGESVFDSVCRMSLTPYESADACGGLVFAASDCALAMDATFVSTVPLEQTRTLRKLLSLTDEHLCLRCDSTSVYGLSQHFPGAGPTVNIRIRGRGKWDVHFEGAPVMVIVDRLPHVPKPVVDENITARDLRRLVPSMTEPVAKEFAAVASALAIVGHGSLLVVSANAAIEAERLANDSIALSAVKLTVPLAEQFSRIDGAILCSPDGLCHAVGVILDGISAKGGDRGRGARFNSATRYHESQDCECAAMVVSEDGGLDLLPRLKPPISKRVIQESMERLEKLSSNPSSPIDRAAEARVINWLENHSFYLSQAQCDAVNQQIATCDEGWAGQSNVQIVRRPLVASGEFKPDRDLIE